MLKIAVVFSLGILSFEYLPLDCVEARTAQLGFIAAILVYLVISRFKAIYYLKSMVIWLFMFSTGVVVFYLHSKGQKVPPPIQTLIHSNALKQIEITKVKETSKSTVLNGKIVGTKLFESTNQIKFVAVDVIIYLVGEHNGVTPKPGDLIEVKEKFDFIIPDQKSEFYFYDQYLIRSGIRFRAFIDDIDSRSVHSSYDYSYWKTVRYRFRLWSSNILSQYLSEVPNQVAQALVLGEKSYLDQELKLQFSKSGIIHILAVSGLHVSFIVYIMYHLLNLVFWRASKYSWIKVSMLAIFLIFYAELTGGANPVWRAVIMAITFLIAKAINKKISSLNILGLAAFIILVIDPEQIYSVSFQLSFSAVIGIIVFFPVLSNIYDPPHWLLRRIRDIIFIGIAAQLSTFPIVLYHFDQVSLISPISGVFAIPLAALVLWMGMGILLFASFLPLLGGILGWALDHLICVLIYLAELTSDMAFGVWSNYPIHIAEACLFMSSILLLAFYFRGQKRRAIFFASCALFLQAAMHSIIGMGFSKF